MASWLPYTDSPPTPGPGGAISKTNTPPTLPPVSFPCRDRIPCPSQGSSGVEPRRTMRRLPRGTMRRLLLLLGRWSRSTRHSPTRRGSGALRARANPRSSPRAAPPRARQSGVPCRQCQAFRMSGVSVCGADFRGKLTIVETTAGGYGDRGAAPNRDWAAQRLGPELYSGRSGSPQELRIQKNLVSRAQVSLIKRVTGGPKCGRLAEGVGRKRTRPKKNGPG